MSVLIRSSHLQLSSLRAPRLPSDYLLMTSTLCVALKAPTIHSTYVTHPTLCLPTCYSPNVRGGFVPVLMLSLPFPRPSCQPKSYLPILLAQFTNYIHHEVSLDLNCPRRHPLPACAIYITQK